MGKMKPPPAKPGKPKKAAPPPEVGASAPPPAAPQPAGLVAPTLPPIEYRGTLPLGRLRPSPTNPRKTFDEGPLRELAASIGSLGLLQPLLVRPVGPAPRMGPKGWEGVDHFEVVAGERRFRALQLNGAAEAAVTARLLSDADVAWVQLVENDQREDVRPSERAAAYAALAAAGQTAEQISAATGVPLSAVRDLVRLAKLPAWALAAVDAGTLPVSTAALVAKVPGEESRKRAAAEVMFGILPPAGEDLEKWVARELKDCQGEVQPISYRETKQHLQQHYTRELKGSPFSLSVVDLVPGVPSCKACPDRAGNNAEAKADGIRADTCLNPDCYREKVEAHDCAELVKATRQGYLMVPEEFAWPAYLDSPPRGWCDLDAPAQVGDLSADLQGTKHGPTKLRDLLKLDRTSVAGGPLTFAALDPKHKLRFLIQTAHARKLLATAGVLKKPERAKPAAKPKGQVDEEWLRKANETAGPPGGVKPAEGKPLVSKVAEWEADERAAVIAANVLREYAEEQCSALAELPDAGPGGPIRGALELVARAFVYDVAQNVNSYDADSVRDVLKARFPIADLTSYHLSASDKVVDPALEQMTAPQLLALLLQLAAAMELGNGPNRETGKAMLDWAELDWPSLTEQARRELAGGETADERLAGAEAAEPQTSAAFEGGWIGDFGLTPEQCRAACILSKFDKPPKEPVSVKPVQPNDGTALYVTLGSVGQYGHESFEAVKLYNPTGFAVSFPDRPTTLSPSYPDAEEIGPAADEARRNAYWGVRVRCGKAEYVVGPRTDTRRFTTKEPAGRKAVAS